MDVILSVNGTPPAAAGILQQRTLAGVAVLLEDLAVHHPVAQLVLVQRLEGASSNGQCCLACALWTTLTTLLILVPLGSPPSGQQRQSTAEHCLASRSGGSAYGKGGIAVNSGARNAGSGARGRISNSPPAQQPTQPAKVDFVAYSPQVVPLSQALIQAAVDQRQGSEQRHSILQHSHH